MKYMILARLFILFLVESVNFQILISASGTHLLKLLQDARVEILIHVTVLEGIMSSLLRRSNRRAQVLELRCEAHADLKGISHDRERRIQILWKN